MYGSSINSIQAMDSDLDLTIVTAPEDDSTEILQKLAEALENSDSRYTKI